MTNHSKKFVTPGLSVYFQNTECVGSHCVKFKDGVYVGTFEYNIITFSSILENKMAESISEFK